MKRTREWGASQAVSCRPRQPRHLLGWPRDLPDAPRPPPRRARRPRRGARRGTRRCTGPSGFYRTESPTRHFRTSVTASDGVRRGGRRAAAPHRHHHRVRRGGRPRRAADRTAPDSIPGWNCTASTSAPAPRSCRPASAGRRACPTGWRGWSLANEWLDNVPCHVAEVDPRGVLRLLHVDPRQRAGDPGREPARPLRRPGARGVGRRAGGRSTSRASGWRSAAPATVPSPASSNGSTHGLRAGRRLRPRPLDAPVPRFAPRPTGKVDRCRSLPDGSRDVTADVATDAVAAAVGGTVLRQRDALLALGLGGRSDVPPLPTLPRPSLRPSPTRWQSWCAAARWPK